MEYGAAAVVVGSLGYTPRPLANALSRLYVRLLDLALPRLRQAAYRNLEIALPDAGAEQHRQIVDGSFRSVARTLVSFAHFSRLDRGNISEWIRYEGYEHYEAALRHGRGVLFATAHLGNWELSAVAHALMSAPMHVVVRRLDNPKIDAVVERRRTLCGNRIIEKKDLARGILKALAKNEAVGILIDQNTNLSEGVFVDFFGVPACAGVGFAKMAAHTGATVIPGFALWSEQERRYVLRFYPPMEITGEPKEDTQRLHRRLEQVIRAHPDQWLWMHRRWKTRPPGEPPLY